MRVKSVAPLQYNKFTILVNGSRKYPYSPHGRPLEIHRGRGVLKAKLLVEKYESKLELPGGGEGAGKEVQN